MEDNDTHPFGYIYISENIENGKKYVGQTTSERWGEDKVPIEERWKEEVSETYRKARRGENLRYIENAIIKYGEDKFKLTEQDIAYNQQDLDNKETHWIREFDTMNPEKGYNLKEGGLGGKLSEAAKEQVSDSIKEKYRTDPEYYEKQVEERRARTENQEWVDKMTKINQERGKDPKFREKVSNSIKQKYRTDPEYYEKQKEERRARVENQEWVEKMIEINQERAEDPTWVEKMTEINQEIARSPKTREKMSKVLKSKWQDEDYQENVSKGVTNKWQESEYRQRQFKSRSEGRKKIPDKRKFLKEIRDMNKKDLNEKYEMDGKCINRRIKEMLGNQGVTNFSQAKKYLENKDLDKVFRDVSKRLKNLPQRSGVKKEILNIRKFLKDLQNMTNRELEETYNMNRSTIAKRIHEMLGGKKIKNLTEAKNYLEGKNLDEIQRNINENLKDKSRKYKKKSIISNIREFLNDIKDLQKKEIIRKYGMSGKTVNNKIKEILEERGIKNYTEAKEYLMDKDVDKVLKDLEEKASEDKKTQDEEVKSSESEASQGNDYEVIDGYSDDYKKEDFSEIERDTKEEKDSDPKDIDDKEDNSNLESHFQEYGAKPFPENSGPPNNTETYPYNNPQLNEEEIDFTEIYTWISPQVREQMAEKAESLQQEIHKEIRAEDKLPRNTIDEMNSYRNNEELQSIRERRDLFYREDELNMREVIELSDGSSKTEDGDAHNSFMELDHDSDIGDAIADIEDQEQSANDESEKEINSDKEIDAEQDISEENLSEEPEHAEQEQELSESELEGKEDFSSDSNWDEEDTYPPLSELNDDRENSGPYGPIPDWVYDAIDQVINELFPESTETEETAREQTDDPSDKDNSDKCEEESKPSDINEDTENAPNDEKSQGDDLDEKTNDLEEEKDQPNDTQDKPTEKTQEEDRDETKSDSDNSDDQLSEKGVKDDKSDDNGEKEDLGPDSNKDASGINPDDDIYDPINVPIHELDPAISNLQSSNFGDYLNNFDNITNSTFKDSFDEDRSLPNFHELEDVLPIKMDDFDENKSPTSFDDSEEETPIKKDVFDDDIDDEIDGYSFDDDKFL